jgi:hypothetical protein
MSIAIIHEPPPFQPVLTDGIFYTVSADTTGVYKFRYTYDVYVNGTLEFSAKATPNPFGIGLADVSRVLKTYCFNNPIGLWDTTQIYQHQTFPFAAPYFDETINYQVYFGYEYSSTPLGPVTGFTGVGSGQTQGNPGVSTPLKKVFQSTMGVNGRATQQDFNMDPFVLSGDPTTSNPTTSGLFLTNSPRTRNIQETEYYTLPFTNYYLDTTTVSEPYYAQWTFYDVDGVAFTAVTADNIISNGGGPRTDCLSVYPALPLVIPSGNTNYNTLYVAAGPANFPFWSQISADTIQYTVQLFGKFTGTTSPIIPTPTPTPTPSTTPQACPCLTYEVTNPSLESQGIFTYRDCSNIPQTLVVSPGQTFYVCVCNTTSFTVQGPLIVTYVSPCVVPSPTPEPTPTPTPCLCQSYRIEYTGITTGATVSYVFCTGAPVTFTAFKDQVYTLCACAGTITSPSPDVSIILNGPC